eukprot:TRINITY_DN5540_c0_g1_i5.p1 TRINITY_DN5540_c0_g1~~TRINITY_DN5540_c0_g1_i5.p1  ORF type:complete len:131 (-),score=27.52 TRINITY_DN5540_c0_g1_i5:107-499(-)
MIRRPPRSTLSSSSAASDVYKRQVSTQSTGISIVAADLRDRAAMAVRRTPNSCVCPIPGPAYTMPQIVSQSEPGFILRFCDRTATSILAARRPFHYSFSFIPVSYTHLRAHETPEHLVCRLLLEKKKKKK